ncbi:uroporphyrinogen decarboxylase [Aquimarina hainanensis]|uniref:Uroporphyrinogen decarboxylase n=1 Tax=Aquimarina hainanensis TaxID=1578017 RepID=A0ABW5N7F0_9FLAO|nr:uroporphyrinogen decarboxylase [Aquimarina sp. TRL1]QKX05615.1 uroporphyrinogen decarboxylase [Aquimarina sp. TRL1]
MEETMLVDIVGYFASFMVLISFLMKNIKTLRLVNSIGCIAFIVYGVLLNWSLPIIITNAAIVLINIYYLFVKKA